MATAEGEAVVRGIVLAGGLGSRLDPVTRVASKQLQPVYDKPMIYYPLSTLMQAGITEILIITAESEADRFKSLLRDGHQWGLSFAYAFQSSPRGLADAFIVGEEFVSGEPVTLILGDNIFYGRIGLEYIVRDLEVGAWVFGYPVRDPERYGVVEFDSDGRVLSLEEKPSRPRSRFAIPGLYVYDGKVSQLARELVPSARGEIEITDLNRAYLERGELNVQLIDRGVAWLDSGTHDSLLEAANFIATVERRQSIKIACVEEVAYEQGFIDITELRRLIETYPPSPYRDYLDAVAAVAAAGAPPA